MTSLFQTKAKDINTVNKGKPWAVRGDFLTLAYSVGISGEFRSCDLLYCVYHSPDFPSACVSFITLLSVIVCAMLETELQNRKIICKGWASIIFVKRCI